MTTINQDEVSRNIIYEQLYNEMRRYRDYEMVITGWYSTLLLGVIAGLFSIRGAQIIFENFWIWIAGTFIAIVGGFIGYIIWYSHNRYMELRKLANHKFPNEKVDHSKPSVQPHHLLIAIISILTGMTILVLLVTTKVV